MTHRRRASIASTTALVRSLLTMRMDVMGRCFEWACRLLAVWVDLCLLHLLLLLLVVLDLVL